MKIGISLPEALVNFADEESERRATSRSGLLAQLLEEAKTRRDVSAYIDRYGWDVTEDEEGWKKYQADQIADAYGSDEW